MVLQINDLSPEVLSETINVICKYQADANLVKASINKIFS
jgi:hypothetical protein